MIGKTIRISKESEKQIVIQNLRNMGVFEGQKGEKLHSMGYFALVYLLAVHKAMLS